MKYNLLLGCLMICIVMSASAQITITQSDFSNLNGVTIVQIFDTTNLTAFTAGNAGANQSWNLSAIGKDTKDTLKFLNPTGLKCASNFPEATYALQTPSFDGYHFISITNSSLDFLGFCGVVMPPDITMAPYTPAYKRLSFPATYNTSFTGTTTQILQFALASPPVDSGRLVMTISYSSLVDGWGDVMTPVGTYHSLRVKTTKTQVDSVYTHVAGNWISQSNPSTRTETTYDWWVKNNFPVASLTVDTSGQVTDASYSVFSTDGVDESTSVIPTTYIYPNPTSATFTIMNTQPSARTFLIINLLGQTVLEAPIADPVIQFSTSTMTKGIYMTIIRDAKGETLCTGKLVVE